VTLAAFTFTDRVTPLIELGIGDTRTPSLALWDSAEWDTAPAFWSGLEPSWLDVSCDVQTVSMSYGRPAVSDRFIAGMARVMVDNVTGWADPNTDDPPGELTVRPGRPIRISVNHVVFGRRTLFRGFIDEMVPTYNPDGIDTVELVCIDALGEVNRTKMVPLAVPVGAGETASARVARILDAAGWTPRDVLPSPETLLATDLGGQVADLLGVTADSAGGVVFGDLSGRVAFRPRDWQTYVPADPVDATIGNVAGDVCPTRWERPFIRADITTRAIIGRDRETAVTVDDTDAITRYGVEPFERTDLVNDTDTSFVLLAERVLQTRGAGTAPRVRSVSLDASTSDAALDLMATVDVYEPSRYRCRLVHPEPRGTVFDDVYFATGVGFDMDRDGWRLELNLDVAAPFAVAGGRWDHDYWDAATWTDAASDPEPTGVFT
jgi:hypothetical protein